MTVYPRLLTRALLMMLCVLLIIPVMSVTWGVGARRATRAVMRAAFAFGAFVISLRVRTEGALTPERPLLLVSNHFSYLDMFALGSIVPAAFTPKSEIASWPVLGMMCRAAGCLFIDRRASKTMQNKAALDAALRAGDIISLFPEGTTNDGTALLSFRSAFFSIAEHKDMKVQPLSIVYTRLSGKPVDRAALPIIGWYGDAEFFPHLLRFLRERSVEALLIFHPPVRGRDFASRKELAQHCRNVIEKSAQHAHTA